MVRLKLILPVLCSIILAAHFLRDRSFAFMLAALLSIPFAFVRKRWVARSMQCFYILATVEWVNTACTLAAQRMEAGLPWLRMAAILGTVALLTLFSVLVVKERPPELSGPAPPLPGKNVQQ